VYRKLIKYMRLTGCVTAIHEIALSNRLRPSNCEAKCLD
jgi:hypothetical protein